MTKSSRNALLAVVSLLVLIALWFFARGRVHFDWVNLKLQLRAVDWRLVLAGAAAIHISMLFRAVRWRLLMGQSANVSSVRLVPGQFIGFTVVALFGRVADLARPYLVARRTATPVATQLAIYSIERAFDLASAAILFSLTLAFAPHDMPHHEAFKRAGLVSLAATLFLAIFAISVRFAGATIAGMARQVSKLVSEKFAESAAAKILEFRDGLRTIASGGQFAGALVWSLVIWVLIASSYFFTMHAFRSTPELANVTIPGTMLVLATSMGGSLLQLPVLGWFTQIGVLAVALHGFLGAPLEVASAAGAMLLVVTTLCIVPAGLICAKIEGVGLRDAAAGGEAVAAETFSED